MTENTYSQLTQNDSLFDIFSYNEKEDNHSKIENMSIKEFNNIFKNHIQNEEEIKINEIYLTDKSPSSEIIESKTEDIRSPIISKNIFTIINSTENTLYPLTKKKRGRQANRSDSKGKKNQKVHNKFATDNLLRKIQVHYMSCILEAINEVLKALNYKTIFLKCNYQFKKNVNKDFFESLKNKKLSDIITNNISAKYRNKDINTNRIIYENLKDDEILKKLFDENYLTFFENVYYKSDKKFNLKQYGLEKEIIFSKNVKMFKDLLKDNKNNDVNNKEYIQNLNICVTQNYLPNKKFLMY